MAKNTLVISVDLRETRVALIEDGIIAELHIERGGAKSSTVGNVYLGKVTRVLPGLQAAFIDIGQERAAFLHVEDLIRPDDFETYLQGAHKKKATNEVGSPSSPDEEGEDHDGDVVDAPSGAALPPALESAIALHAMTDASSDDIARDADASSARDVTAADSDIPPAHDRHADHQAAVLLARAASADSSSVRLLPEDRASVEALAIEDARETPQVAKAEHTDPPRPAAAIVVPQSQPAPVGDAHDADDDSGDLDAGAEDDASEQELDGDDDIDGEVDGDDDIDADIDADVDQDAPTRSPAQLAKAKISTEFDLPGFTVEGENDLPGFTISEPGEAVPRAAGGRDDRGGGGRRRRRGRRGAPEGRTNDRGPDRKQGSGGGGGDRKGGRPQDARRSRSKDATPSTIKVNRISKTTPIREVVQEGQEVIVQVSKDPIGTKGARCTSHVSLPGRYVVYLPTVEHVGVSKRIGSDKERSRLREAIDNVKPPTGGLIVRTLAEGLTKKQLKQDVGYLVRLWEEVAKKREGSKAPALLTSELDIVLKVARDLFTDDVDEVVIDDKYQYERLCRFVEVFAPDRVKDVKMYTGDEPVFDEYGIEDEIQRALDRKVTLPSGGHLVIDQAEALTAIDVNTGRFVGKGSKDMEETILKTNLEAVNEIAYQLRFRNIGGLIILDLIDMERSSNREKVRRTLEELLEKDKAKTTLNRISDLGLIEMTRKRTRESLGRMMHEPCFYCDGTGQVQSKETIAYKILREIKRRRRTLPGYSVVVSAHPAVIDLLQGEEKATIVEAENKYMRKIHLNARKDYHFEQFDIVGK
jgi:ribonuclease G